jgi:hypothetical protein
MILPLIYFLGVSLGLGFAAWRLLGMEEEDGIAAVFMYLATGIVIFVQATTVLGFLKLSDWLVYLLLTVVLLGLAYWKKGLSFKKPQLTNEWKIVGIVFLLLFLVYLSGSFGYAWLEDDDPWQHADAVRYVSIFSTYIQPPQLPIHYLAPYTPFYDVIMGVLFQVDGSSIQTILKFFNPLLISLAVPFFFCWAKERFDARRAMWATFIIAILPSFMSHFIWAQTLCVMLVFPALYFLEKYLKSEGAGKNGFAALAVLSMASVMITQPSAAAMFFGLVAAFIVSLALVKIVQERKIDAIRPLAPLAALFLAAFVLALIEFWIPMFAMYPADAVMDKLSLSTKILTDRYGDTGGGLVYGFSDFWEAPFSSKMDQPVGWGAFVFVLVVVGLVSCILDLKGGRNREAAALSILWFVFGMVGTEGNLLPVKLVPHRFWVFLAIPVALLAGIGAVWLLEYQERTRKGLAMAPNSIRLQCSCQVANH